MLALVSAYTIGNYEQHLLSDSKPQVCHATVQHSQSPRSEYFFTHQTKTSRPSHTTPRASSRNTSPRTLPRPGPGPAHGLPCPGLQQVFESTAASTLVHVHSVPANTHVHISCSPEGAAQVNASCGPEGTAQVALPAVQTGSLMPMSPAV